MIRLLLLRHAKSSWSDPALEDRDRPLSERGLAAAPAMGAFMRKEKLIPDLVLCSPARRALDTWTLASNELGASPKVLVEDAVYDFGNGERVLDAVRGKGSGATAVLVVGHNPSLERLAPRLVGRGDPELRRRMAEKYPTCALAVLDFEISSWKHVKDGQALLVSFIRPKDIRDGE
ncbi:MAG: SixA phosphatase family protein [Hyphomicrobiales bacterium]